MQTILHEDVVAPDLGDGIAGDGSILALEDAQRLGVAGDARAAQEQIRRGRARVRAVSAEPFQPMALERREFELDARPLTLSVHVHAMHESIVHERAFP